MAVASDFKAGDRVQYNVGYTLLDGTVRSVGPKRVIVVLDRYPTRWRVVGPGALTLLDTIAPPAVLEDYPDPYPLIRAWYQKHRPNDVTYIDAIFEGASRNQNLSAMVLLLTSGFAVGRAYQKGEITCSASTTATAGRS